MAQFVNIYPVDLQKGPVEVPLNRMYLEDIKANRVGVTVTDGGAAVTLGGTCSGTAILSNGSTVAISGTTSGNQAYIELPSAVYTVDGPVEVFVNLTNGGVTATLLHGHGTVVQTDTGTVIDPGTIIPSVSALIDSIDAAVASIPADYSDLLSAIAPTFSASTAYAAGRYVWYSGDLYRFTADHAAGSWKGTDAVQVVVTDDITGSATGIVDFNTYITSGKTYIGSTEMQTALNRPPLTGSFCLLVVNVSDTGVVMQSVVYSQLGAIYTRRRNAAGTSWSEWLPTSEMVIAAAQGTIDFNNYMTQGSIYIGSTEMGTASNAPTNSTVSYCIVHVEVATNNVITQTAVFPLTGAQYIRRRNADGTSWSEWLAPKIPDIESELSELSDDVTSLKNDITGSVTGIVDFNTYITSGKKYIGSTEVGTALNRPPLTGSFCLLVVNVSDTGVVMQTAVYSQLGGIYTRRRNIAGTWSEWLPTSEGAIYLDVLFTNPVVTKLCFTTKQARKGLQDIAVYNGNIFDMESGYVYVNGGAKFAIDNGHGNNAMFGETLHGDYPYLYCGSWTKDECAIYVNQVTNESATLVRTISFSGLSGYLNMCVDEADGKIYILLCTSAQTSTGDIDFIVADLSTGEIISRKTLDFKIPILQGMQFSNDRIYVAYGNVASGIPNRIIALTPNGDISCKSNPISVSEIEGIAFDGNKMYIADTSNIYSM